MFILFIPKQSQIKKFIKIKDQTIKNIIVFNNNYQLFNINRPKHNNFFAQIIVIIEIIILNNKFILEFDTKGNKKEKVNIFKLLSILLAIKSEITNQNKVAQN